MKRLKYGVRKMESHAKNVETWREVSNLNQLPEEQEYWTLADPESVEYASMSSLGVLTSRHQYHVVNDDESKMALIRKYHSFIPESNFHLGDWCRMMRINNPCPKGGIVYIDSTSEPDNRARVASMMLASAMQHCGPKTLLCMNVCSTRPLAGHRLKPLTTFFDNVEELAGSSGSLWARLVDCNGQGEYHPPRTSLTQMTTLFYWRPE